MQKARPGWTRPAVGLLWAVVSGTRVLPSAASASRFGPGFEGDETVDEGAGFFGEAVEDFLDVEAVGTADDVLDGAPVFGDPVQGWEWWLVSCRWVT